MQVLFRKLQIEVIDKQIKTAFFSHDKTLLTLSIFIHEIKDLVALFKVITCHICNYVYMWLYNINAHVTVLLSPFCTVARFPRTYDMRYDDNTSNVVLNLIYTILSMVKINKLNMN